VPRGWGIWTGVPNRLRAGVDPGVEIGGHTQDYCLEIKEDWESGDGMGLPSVPETEAFFCETTHDICIKIQQTTVVAVTG